MVNFEVVPISCMHFGQPVCQYWKMFWNCFFISSSEPPLPSSERPLRSQNPSPKTDCRWGNKKNVIGARSEMYGCSAYLIFCQAEYWQKHWQWDGCSSRHFCQMYLARVFKTITWYCPVSAGALHVGKPFHTFKFSWLELQTLWSFEFFSCGPYFSLPYISTSPARWLWPKIVHSGINVECFPMLVCLF